MNAVTDEALMDMIGENLSGQAASELVGRHKEHAYLFALKLVGNSEHARDASQEAFVKLLKNADKYASDRPFWPWFAAILRNCVRDIQRGRLRFGKIGADELIRHIEDAKADPTIGARSAELWRRVLALPPKYRDVIVLRHFEEMSYQQIADVMGVPINTVSTWLYQARGRLVEQDEL